MRDRKIARVTCHRSGCGKTFAGDSSLKRHIKMLHNKERPHSCGTCGKRFSWKSQLKRHHCAAGEEEEDSEEQESEGEEKEDGEGGNKKSEGGENEGENEHEEKEKGGAKEIDIKKEEIGEDVKEKQEIRRQALALLSAAFDASGSESE